MKKIIFSKEELNALEALEIKGGVSSPDALNEECTNSGCPIQALCTHITDCEIHNACTNLDVWRLLKE